MKAVAFLLGLIAFMLFALSTNRHHERGWGRRCSPRAATGLRIAAWVCVGVDFVMAIVAWGAVFGPIGWVASCMVGAAATFLLLNLLPAPPPHRKARP
ncbi:MAG: peptidoglycan biosynthesis protein MviN/MurJ (putative lipid II flippase) [Sphingomonas echinoides]|jgi:peptidoglycan biosynthesis protein MviN/MurJ (putative lipid II flippase)